MATFQKNNWICKIILIVVVVLFMVTGIIAIGRGNHDNTKRQETIIGADGIVVNGPFRTCECSGSLFFGEGRIQCLHPERRLVGELVAFCVWNDMVQIEDIRTVQVVVGGSHGDGGYTAEERQSQPYALVEEGIPDILTHVHVQKDRLVAVVATTLDASWFPNNSTVQSPEVVVQADGVFSVLERGGKEDYERRRRYLRNMQKNEGNGVPVAVLLIGSVLIGACFLLCFFTWLCGESPEEAFVIGEQQLPSLPEIYKTTTTQPPQQRLQDQAENNATTLTQSPRRQRNNKRHQSVAASEATAETAIGTDYGDGLSVTCMASESVS